MIDAVLACEDHAVVDPMLLVRLLRSNFLALTERNRIREPLVRLGLTAPLKLRLEQRDLDLTDQIWKSLDGESASSEDPPAADETSKPKC